MTRDEALAAYWSATSHAEEHAAYQWLIRLGVVDGEICPECRATDRCLSDTDAPAAVHTPSTHRA